MLQRILFLVVPVITAQQRVEQGNGPFAHLAPSWHLIRAEAERGCGVPLAFHLHPRAGLQLDLGIDGCYMRHPARVPPQQGRPPPVL